VVTEKSVVLAELSYDLKAAALLVWIADLARSVWCAGVGDGHADCPGVPGNLYDESPGVSRGRVQDRVRAQLVGDQHDVGAGLTCGQELGYPAAYLPYFGPSAVEHLAPPQRLICGCHLIAS
jgi:hypothetical protein